MTRIIREGDAEDTEIKMRRYGRLIVISTERASIARAFMRQLTDNLEDEPTQDLEPAIGFHADE